MKRRDFLKGLMYVPAAVAVPAAADKLLESAPKPPHRVIIRTGLPPAVWRKLGG